MAKRVVSTGRLYGRSRMAMVEVQLDLDESPVGVITGPYTTPAPVDPAGPLDLAFRRVDAALMQRVHESRRARRG